MYRLREGYNTREIAEYCGVTHTTVYRWEDGSSLPRADSLAVLSALYAVRMDDLIVTYF